MDDIPRRDMLQLGGAGLLGLMTPRELAAAGRARHPRHAVAENQRRERDRDAPGGVRLGGQDHHGSGRPVRLRLRHLHAARRPGGAGGREVPQALSSSASRPTGSKTPGSRATTARTGRTGRCSTTPSAAWTRRSGTSRGGRPECRSINCLAASAARRAPPTRSVSGSEIHAGRSTRSALHGAGLPARSRAGGRAGHGGLRLGAARNDRGRSALHDRPSSSRPYIRARVKLLDESREAARRRGRAAARRARARLAEPGRAVRQGRGRREAVLPGGRALARGHRLLPPDPRSNAARRSRWASCSTARTNGRSSPSGSSTTSAFTCRRRAA